MALNTSPILLPGSSTARCASPRPGPPGEQLGQRWPRATASRRKGGKHKGGKQLRWAGTGVLSLGGDTSVVSVRRRVGGGGGSRPEKRNCGEGGGVTGLGQCESKPEKLQRRILKQE